VTDARYVKNDQQTETSQLTNAATVEAALFRLGVVFKYIRGFGGVVFI
jgi:hypothetical protein